MKLDEKLMKLRKENAWSQEEFADKLNVSRQTVSKWELGQTTPDTDNLSKIASIFGISVNDLLDENTNPIGEKSKTNNTNNSPLKIFILIIILIFVFLGIGAITINKIFNKITNPIVPKSIIEMFEEYSLSDIFSEIFGHIKNSEKKFNQDSFNGKFKTLYYGSTDGFFMANFIDDVIKSNEENPKHIITVNYKGIETSDVSELRKMKKNFKNGTKYEISYEYDEDGLINKTKIER